MDDNGVSSRSSDALVLPAPFAGVPVRAYVEQRQRQLTWSLREPGQLFRNRFWIAWIRVKESDGWRGEPLWLSATRRVTESAARTPFTDTARQRLHDLVVPVLARYGFDRYWTDTHAASHSPTTGTDSAAAARREAEWWDAVTDLADMHHSGRLTFRVVNADRSRPHRELVATNFRYGSRRTSEEIIAEALHQGEHVGWMTVDGDLVPDGSILEGPRR